MKIRIRDLQKIIREEVSAHVAGRLDEAGDLAAWYAARLRVPPALQYASLVQGGKFLQSAIRQIKNMHLRAQEVGSVVPPEVAQLVTALDAAVTAHAAALSVVGATVKRMERKMGGAVAPAAPAREETEEELEARLAAMRKAREMAVLVGGGTTAGAPSAPSAAGLAAAAGMSGAGGPGGTISQARARRAAKRAQAKAGTQDL